MDKDLKPSPTSVEQGSINMPSHKKKLNKRFVVELIGVVIIILLSLSSIGSVPEEDYNKLQAEYTDLQDNYSNLQDRLEDVQDKLDKTSASLNNITADYETFQERMSPFAELSDEEISTIVTEMEQKATEEEAARIQAEQAAQQQAQAAQAQAEAEAQAAAQAQQPQGEMVWIPQTGSKYHSNSSCSNMKNPTQVTISEAQSRGYEPCKKCY